MSEQLPTAFERDLLGQLGFWRDTRTTYHAADLAALLGASLPRTQAALVRLRQRGMVRYYEGHPGKWAVTHDGRAIIEADAAVPRAR